MKYLFLSLFFCLNLAAKEPRIVSLDPAITESIFSIGKQTTLVGRTKHCDYPSEVKNISVVGDYNNPMIERILLLKPTHVLAYSSGRPKLLENLKKYDIDFISLKTDTPMDYMENLKILEKTFAWDLSKHKRQWLEQYTSLKKKKARKGLLLLGHSPIVLAGEKSFISKALNRCGFVNLGKASSSWPQITREKLITLSPRLIVDLKMNNSKNEILRKLVPEAQILSFNGDGLFRLGPRFPKSVKKLCDALEL